MIFTLKQTCDACPEQYDVFIGTQQVGYLRLRHGHFRCEYPVCGGEILYIGNPIGDGMFEEDERDIYLRHSLSLIAKRLGVELFSEEIEYEII